MGVGSETERAQRGILMRMLKVQKTCGVIAAGFLAGAVICGGALQATRSHAVEMLRVGGTGASTGMSRIIGSVYSRRVGVAGIEVVEGLGSGGGIKAVTAGAVDISFSSRPLTEKEQRKGIVASPILRTPFVAVTSHPDARDLRAADFSNYYGWAEAKWADGTPVKIILRPKSESDTKLMEKFFPGMAEAIEAARARGEVPVAQTDQDNVTMAEVTRGSLTSGTMLQMLAENRPVRIMSFDGVAPTVEAMVSGEYPYSKTLYIVHAESPSPAVADFAAFLRSPAGIAELAKIGAAPAR